VPSRRLFGPRPTRTSAEIPQGRANHRLVYRIIGDYVLDNSAMRLDSPEVLAATHVSLVDVSQGREVMVQLDIPSRDADSFTLQATFMCAVTDPVLLVREGPHDMELALRGYLKGHHRIFELGLDYRLTEINDVRRKLNAQVKAYTTVHPAVFLGLAAYLASVEVLTPEELAKFNQSLREQEHKYAIDFKQQENQHLLHRDQTMYEQSVAIGSQRHELDLDATRRQYQRFQHREQLDAVATDPRSALNFAYSVGDISAKEYAEEMLRLDRAEIDAANEEKMRDREDAREQRNWERDVSRRDWEADREEKAQEWRHRIRQAEVERDNHRLQQQWKRDDEVLDREEKGRLFAAGTKIIGHLIERGHLDTADVNLERVVKEILDERGDRNDGDPAPVNELGPAAAERPADGDRQDDAELREEDAH
jgi:hypothetical protein